MPLSNAEIAEAFREMADLLEISGGASPFRVRAYRTAADAIQDEPRALRDMVANGDDLTTLPGIGAGIFSIAKPARAECPGRLVSILSIYE